MPEPTEPAYPLRWEIAEEATTIAVDGATVVDPVDGEQLTVVVVRMPAFVVENLAGVLAGWSKIAAVMREALDESDLAGLLRAAARAARRLDIAGRGDDSTSD